MAAIRDSLIIWSGVILVGHQAMVVAIDQSRAQVTFMSGYRITLVQLIVIFMAEGLIAVGQCWLLAKPMDISVKMSSVYLIKLN